MAKEKILISDDSPTIVEILKFALMNEGYEVVTASDGIEAIDQTYAENPDIILLDILMPKMNGYQVCRLLKGDVLTASIPVIMLTGQDQPKDKFWGLQTGADRYIIKDFESNELFDAISELLKTTEKTRSQRKSGPLKTSMDNILFRINDLLDKKLFQTTILNEINRIARTYENSEEIIREILALLQKVVDYDVGGILLKSNDLMNLTIYINHHIDDKLIDQIINKIKSSAINYNIDLKETSLCINTFNAAKERSEGKQVNREVIRSFRSFPMMAHKSTTGLLSIGSSVDNAFSGEMLEIINVVVNEAAIVIENAMLYDEIKRLAITDGLTKCYNHRHFQEILESEFTRSTRYGSKFALLIADIDFFKSINDNFGHQTGDILLRGFVSLLKSNLRDIDFIARYGGEEFAVIMPETELQGAIDTSERLRKFVENYIFSGLPPNRKITVSIGVGGYPALKVKTQFELIEKVDQALYQAKKTGRNKVCVAEELSKQD